MAGSGCGVSFSAARCISYRILGMAKRSGGAGESATRMPAGVSAPDGVPPNRREWLGDVTPWWLVAGARPPGWQRDEPADVM
jgi:hypothetical protein